MADLTASDVALLNDRGGDANMFSGVGAFFWVFALLLLNNGWGGNGNYGRGNGVTYADLADSQNAQTQQMQMNNLGIQMADQNYQNAQLINNQTNQMLQQNNTNLINAIQGFNNLGLQIQNQTNTLGSAIQQLSAQMNECCCSIKTQMLQDRLDEAERRNVVLQNSLDNANQSQYILGQLGRFVAWAGSGSQAVAAATGQG